MMFLYTLEGWRRIGYLFSWENLSKDLVLFAFSNTGTTDDGLGENQQILGVYRVHWFLMQPTIFVWESEVAQKSYSWRFFGILIASMYRGRGIYWVKGSVPVLF